MLDESFDLGRAFYRKQAALRNDLEADREVATHPGAKGDGSELHWKEMLSGFLSNPAFGIFTKVGQHHNKRTTRVGI